MAIAQADLNALLDHVDANLDQSLERLFDWLRIPSISTDPAYASQCEAAAAWLAEELNSLGFEAAPRATDGHPMVVGHAPKPGSITALFYGHYDVQPVDPLNLWKTDPFSPEIVTGPDGVKRIFARGASDDKGQVMTFVEACRAYRQVMGDLPIGIKMLIEGEEESASASFAPFVSSHVDELSADVGLACDTGLWDENTPCIYTALRGLVAEEMVITCATRDLHSGGYGSAARNPNQVVADLVASLRNPDGSVAIDGFYDDVIEPSADQRAQWAALGFDEAGHLGRVGLKTAAGEQGYTIFEQINARPTCEINGLSGGYTGDGFKTVIPAKAVAKISFRLVAAMDPEKVRAQFHRHILDRLPADCTVEFHDHGAASAFMVSQDNPHMLRAKAALTDEWGQPTATRGGGGSIPAMESVQKILGLDTLLIGFAQDDDAVHSPNEKYDLRCFHKGIRSWVRILAALAD